MSRTGDVCYVYIYVCVCVCVCTFIYINMHVHRHTRIHSIYSMFTLSNDKLPGFLFPQDPKLFRKNHNIHLHATLVFGVQDSAGFGMV